MMELKTQLRLALLADPVLSRMLNWVANTNGARRGIFIAHLSQFKEVAYPCISLFIQGGADFSVVFAEDVPVMVDIWTEERAEQGGPPGMAYGNTGAFQIYRRLKLLLQQCHLTGTLRSAAYQLVRFAELPSAMMEDFDTEQSLHHVSTRFRARLIPTDAELVTPN